MANANIYNLLSKQIPESVREKYPVFCLFMKCYYKFLATRGISNISDLQDIDTLYRGVKIKPLPWLDDDGKPFYYIDSNSEYHLIYSWTKNDQGEFVYNTITEKVTTCNDKIPLENEEFRCSPNIKEPDIDLTLFLNKTIVEKIPNKGYVKASVVGISNDKKTLLIRYITKDALFKSRTLKSDGLINSIGSKIFIQTNNKLENHIDQYEVVTAENVPNVFLDNFRYMLDSEGIFSEESTMLTHVLQHVKEFYVRKGSAKSAEFLLRVLRQADCEIYYPWKNTLTISDGKWIQYYSIVVKTTDALDEHGNNIGVQYIQNLVNWFTINKFNNNACYIYLNNYDQQSNYSKSYSIHDIETFNNVKNQNFVRIFLNKPSHDRIPPKLYFGENVTNFKDIERDITVNDFFEGTICYDIHGVVVTDVGKNWVNGQVFKIGGKTVFENKYLNYDIQITPWYFRKLQYLKFSKHDAGVYGSDYQQYNDFIDVLKEYNPDEYGNLLNDKQQALSLVEQYKQDTQLYSCILDYIESCISTVIKMPTPPIKPDPTIQVEISPEELEAYEYQKQAYDIVYEIIDSLITSIPDDLTEASETHMSILPIRYGQDGVTADVEPLEYPVICKITGIDLTPQDDGFPSRSVKSATIIQHGEYLCSELTDKNFNIDGSFNYYGEDSKGQPIPDYYLQDNKGNLISLIEPLLTDSTYNMVSVAQNAIKKPAKPSDQALKDPDISESYYYELSVYKSAMANIEKCIGAYSINYPQPVEPLGEEPSVNQIKQHQFNTDVYDLLYSTITFLNIRCEQYDQWVIDHAAWSVSSRHTICPAKNIRDNTIDVSSYNATFKFSFALLNVSDGYWESSKGQISDGATFVQDSYYYQKFSYDIKTNIRPEDYEHFINRNHPAGTLKFYTYNKDDYYDYEEGYDLDNEFPFKLVDIIDFALITDYCVKKLHKALTDVMDILVASHLKIDQLKIDMIEFEGEDDIIWLDKKTLSNSFELYDSIIKKDNKRLISILPIVSKYYKKHNKVLHDDTSFDDYHIFKSNKKIMDQFDVTVKTNNNDRKTLLDQVELINHVNKTTKQIKTDTVNVISFDAFVPLKLFDHNVDEVYDTLMVRRALNVLGLEGETQYRDYWLDQWISVDPVNPQINSAERDVLREKTMWFTRTARFDDSPLTNDHNYGIPSSTTKLVDMNINDQDPGMDPEYGTEFKL